MKVRITETLEIDLKEETWNCQRCGTSLGSAHDNYKKGCLIHERDMKEIYQPLIEGEAYSFSPNDKWSSLLEIYCPSCGTLIETEYLPPGHPLTHDIQLDLKKLKQKYLTKK
jgi:acetone carboxylase gamma subunit